MKQKDILIIIIPLFIFVLAWIGESAYRNAVNSTIPGDVNQEIAPISPNFDTKAIDKLKSRTQITPSFDVQAVAPTPITLPNISNPPNASGASEILL